MALVTIPGLHSHSHKENQTGRGQIQVIFGPMFSGKTTELLRRLRRYQHANHRTFLIKYEKDNRYDMNGVSTHDRQVSSAISCSKLYELKKSIGPYNVIGIDEGQFFPDVVDFAEEMANNGKIVIVAALDGTFQRQGFGSILNLVPLAESVVKLSAVCMHCYGEGSFTKRLGLEVEVEVIGGADKYMAACRSCHPRKLLAKTNTSKENKENVSKPLRKSPLDSIENKVEFLKL